MEPQTLAALRRTLESLSQTLDTVEEMNREMEASREKEMKRECDGKPTWLAVADLDIRDFRNRCNELIEEGYAPMTETLHISPDGSFVFMGRVKGGVGKMPQEKESFDAEND
jgi:hypothetical protein